MCGTLFALTLISPFFLGGLFWLVLPLFMVIPFCCNTCYDQPGEAGARQQGPQVTVTVTSAPQMQTIQAQPVLVQAQPVMAQPVAVQAQPVQAQPAAATVVATVSNPVNAAEEPQLPQYTSAVTSFEVETSGARGGLPLHDFLVQCELTRYEMAMQEMGALETVDLHDITEDELTAMGMKKLEVRRLQRSLASLQ